MPGRWSSTQTYDPRQAAYPQEAADGGYFAPLASARYLPVPPPPGDPRRLPDSWWGYYDHVLRRDRQTGQWYFEALLPEGPEGQDTPPGPGEFSQKWSKARSSAGIPT